MARQGTPVYFADKNTLGLGKLLRRSGRKDVVYPGHEDLPEIPRGTDDLEWLPIVGARGFIVPRASARRGTTCFTRAGSSSAGWASGARPAEGSVANRRTEDLADVASKVYTRNIYGRD